uniref:Uncharacterized protein n=1 Tax=Arundo donax TaxID=35708 RepID=A0A0A9G437_ARUDO
MERLLTSGFLSYRDGDWRHGSWLAGPHARSAARRRRRLSLHMYRRWYASDLLLLGRGDSTLYLAS